ncbi:hypothetical protein I7I50_05778 [Histoplasma capsulatum G186AR]|uniref:Uncharacterized protein n=1 Tax=Ajellomyces capsulatus TaxID=5037 RepID=A0A8H7ZBR5_AJECA|nr:hypothetical protein I7I52_04037 [Histoplasma capsulatum]QSS76359.1 hypothetical protein I7I50_05778 [Histoplasma capsulatum G186AR]
MFQYASSLVFCESFDSPIIHAYVDTARSHLPPSPSPDIHQYLGVEIFLMSVPQTGSRDLSIFPRFPRSFKNHGPRKSYQKSRKSKLKKNASKCAHQ